MRVLAAVLLSVLVSPELGSAITIHVPGDMPTIQSGIDAASPGDTVLVDAGSYTGPGNRDIDFGGKDIVLRSALGAGATLIDCQASGRGLYFHHHETAAARLEGFTIRNGTNIQAGGAIHCDNASPTISDCVIAGNNAPAGAAISCFYFSSPTFVNCRVIGNTAQEGGAVYCFYARTPLFTRCVMTGNTATSVGGAVSSRYGSAPLLRNCTIAENRAGTGGGLYMYQASAALERCIVWGNCAAEGPVAFIASANPLRFSCSAVDSSGMGGFGSAQYEGPQVFADPLFCDPVLCGSAPTEAGHYTLDIASPCTAAHSPCGELIGALDATCGAETSVSGGMAETSALCNVRVAIRPNPARDGATIAFSIVEPRHVRVTLLDASGRRIAELANGRRETGEYAIAWNGTDSNGRCPSAGIYFARVEVDGVTRTAKLVVLE